MRFGPQGWSNQGWKDALLSTLSELIFESELGTHLRDNHGHLCLWDFELFWPSFKVGQTNVENMHFVDFLGIQIIGVVIHT